MTRLEDRQTLMAEITEACAAGARLVPACSLTGIDVRTFQRWRDEDGQVRADRRPEAVRPQPAHALSEAERARIVELANEPRFARTRFLYFQKASCYAEFPEILFSLPLPGLGRGASIAPCVPRLVLGDA